MGDKIHVYISADYSENDGDRDVVDTLNKWGHDDYHVLNFADLAAVASGSVSEQPDCRYCDLKSEFNRQINASSTVIFVVGNMTKNRTAGSSCERNKKEWNECYCTPYKKNANGTQKCTVYSVTSSTGGDVGNINSYSFLRHEFEQAKRQGKPIIIFYNSLIKKSDWLPSYMAGYEELAKPFWTRNSAGNIVGNYQLLLRELGL